MSELIFEVSHRDHCCVYLPISDVPMYPKAFKVREQALRLPEVSEVEMVRHYMNLSRNLFGVDQIFYPLGSCTMKYNPKINDDCANLEGFKCIHPLQPVESTLGCIEVYTLAERYLCEITGMDAMTFQPAAGAQGELTGMLLVKAYHQSRKDEKRKIVLVPDSAHGTNPASAAMAGFDVVTVASNAQGNVDIEVLKTLCNENTAALMLTNPNTLGLFEKEIEAITQIVHDAGGLIYYDGANLNAIMGYVRPGDMGFDVIHLNLHKTFSTPHGGGGPGSGPVGVKKTLIPFLPKPTLLNGSFHENRPNSIGRMKQFNGHFLVVVRALTYILSLGAIGIKEASGNAVLNANYMMHELQDTFEVAINEPCMHEFVLTLGNLKHKTGVSAMDLAKGMVDAHMHPPTMYFPLIVSEALMFEPTETESKATLDHAIEVLKQLHAVALSNPQKLHDAPLTMPITRVDEVKAARVPHLRYHF